jgi:hypothetical protein
MPASSKLDKIDGLRDRVAELYASGATNKAIAQALFEEFNELEQPPSKETILRWRRDDEQVSEKIHELMKDRTVRTVRKVDSRIEDKLVEEDLTVKELLEIRKAYAPLRDEFGKDEKVDARQLDEDLFGLADEDPEFAERLANADRD